jgi:hypothetical protein
MITPQLGCNLCRSTMFLEAPAAQPLKVGNGVALDWKWHEPHGGGEGARHIGQHRLVVAAMPERAEMHLCDRCCDELRRILGAAA